jgi:hypothetical protein
VYAQGSFFEMLFKLHHQWDMKSLQACWLRRGQIQMYWEGNIEMLFTKVMDPSKEKCQRQS